MKRKLSAKGSRRNNFPFCCRPQARWRGESDERYPGRYVRSEQQSQWACGPQPRGARRRRARIGFVAASRRCPTSPASRRLASARPALAPKCEFISARALRHHSSIVIRHWRVGGHEVFDVDVKGIGNAVDVVEEADDLHSVEEIRIFETVFSQDIQVLRADAPGAARQLDGIV